VPRYPHSTPLTRREIEAVADYIIATLAPMVERAGVCALIDVKPMA